MNVHVTIITTRQNHFTNDNLKESKMKKDNTNDKQLCSRIRLKNKS